MGDANMGARIKSSYLLRNLSRNLGLGLEHDNVGDWRHCLFFCQTDIIVLCVFGSFRKS